MNKQWMKATNGAYNAYNCASGCSITQPQMEFSFANQRLVTKSLRNLQTLMQAFILKGFSEIWSLWSSGALWLVIQIVIIACSQRIAIIHLLRQHYSIVYMSSLGTTDTWHSAELGIWGLRFCGVAQKSYFPGQPHYNNNLYLGQAYQHY